MKSENELQRIRKRKQEYRDWCIIHKHPHYNGAVLRFYLKWGCSHAIS